MLGFFLLVVAVWHVECQVQPGGTIDSTDQVTIANALDVILNDVGILEFTRIAIGVANMGDKTLMNPRWYSHNGNTDTSLPNVIYPEQTGLSLFTRNSASLSGTEGVVTYDIEGTSLCVAIMWNVPNIGSNTMNAKVYTWIVPNEDLYHQMRDIAGEWGTDMWGQRSEYGIDVSGNISTGWAVSQIVYVTSAGYDMSLGPSYNAWCDEKVFGDDICVRECSPLGKCDTNIWCEQDSNCRGNELTCTGPCE